MRTFVSLILAATATAIRLQSKTRESKPMCDVSKQGFEFKFKHGHIYNAGEAVEWYDSKY